MGIYILHHVVDTLGYADDIILICPSVADLMKIMKICEDYAN